MDLYKVLGVERNATEDEINRAHKKLAMKYHPDKNKSPDAVKKMQEINHAKEILLDPTKKNLYDQFGEEGLKMEGNPYAGFPFPFPMNPHATRTEKPSQMEHSITLKDLFTKKNIEINIPQQINCDKCDATGYSDKLKHECNHCHGRGEILQQIRQGLMIFQTSQPCPVCFGQKKDITASHLKCESCVGTGFIKKQEITNVPLPEDILKNNTVLLKGKGLIRQGKRTDLMIHFTLNIPMGYKVTNNELHYEMKISFAESVCGFQKLIDHPSGRQIVIVSNPGAIINPLLIFKLPRLGFFEKYKENPMYISFIIDYPYKVTLLENAKLTWPNLKMSFDGKDEDIIYEGDLFEYYQLNDLEYIGMEEADEPPVQGCQQQ